MEEAPEGADLAVEALEEAPEEEASVEDLADRVSTDRIFTGLILAVGDPADTMVAEAVSADLSECLCSLL